MSATNKNKHDSIDERISLTREAFDSLISSSSIDERISLTKETFDSFREKIRPNTITYTRNESLKEVLEDRSLSNDIIDPIVDGLRIIHGKNCSMHLKIYQNDVEIKDDIVKVGKTTFIFDEDGPFRLVPEGDGSVDDKCVCLALALLEQKLDKMGLKTVKEKTDMKRRILSNRYYEHGGSDDLRNGANLLSLITMESMRGYNSIEFDMKSKTGDSFFD